MRTEYKIDNIIKTIENSNSLESSKECALKALKEIIGFFEHSSVTIGTIEICGKISGEVIFSISVENKKLTLICMKPLRVVMTEKEKGVVEKEVDSLSEPLEWVASQ